MKSSIGIDIAAPAELVFRLARDVGRWPDLLPHYLSARHVGAADADGHVLVRFVARRTLVGALGPGLPVVWRSRTWSEPNRRRLRFVHRGGATNGMDVTWRIEERADGAGCRVEIEHVFRPRIPGWAWFIDRAFTRPIAGRTLSSFRAIAEAVHGAGDPADASEPSPSTNSST